MNIRIVEPSDAAALVAIYAPYVEKTAITFEYEVPSVEEFAGRIRETLKRYPYLVAEDHNEILGYAYASVFHARKAYDWSVETSIYVKENNHRSGIGHLLYQKLEEALREMNVCNLCACISYPNPRSIAFHEKEGYRLVGHFTSSGYKLGTWHDMVWMEKFIGSHDNPPKDFIPFSALQEQKAKESEG